MLLLLLLLLGRNTKIVYVDEDPGSVVHWLVVGVNVEYSWCEYTTLCQTIFMLSPSAAHIVWFHIESSVG